jgi:hypothetical protein
MGTMMQAEAGLNRATLLVSERPDRMRHWLFFAAVRRTPVMIWPLKLAEDDDCGF